MDDFFANPRRLAFAKPSILEGDKQQLSADFIYEIGHQPAHTLTVGKVGIVPVSGSLSSAKNPGWYWFANMTYENVLAGIDALIADTQIETILLSFNSPGGTVTGCAETAAAIRERCEMIDIISHCRVADSAAYWLASATDRIVVDPTGEVGSIGVIMTHIDMSKMLEDWGYKVTHIYSGAHKADGSPYNPLSEEAKERLQDDLDYLRSLFVAQVSAYRSLAPDAVSGTEALTYIGQRAVDIGLADETAFYSDLIKQLNA